MATDYVEAHVNLIPIELLLKDLCLQAITRMVSLDNEHHPLTKVVWHSLRHPVKRHPSPIHTLARLSGLRIGEVAPPPKPSLEQIKRCQWVRGDNGQWVTGDKGQWVMGDNSQWVNSQQSTVNGQWSTVNSQQSTGQQSMGQQ